MKIPVATTKLLVDQLTTLQLPLVNKFYKQQKARGKAKGNEMVWTVKANGQIIAAARLADISGNCFLTGVQVDAHYQRQGVAKRLIGTMLTGQQPGQGDCYTFPYRHLVRLYQGLGFVEVTDADLPKPLQMRFARYRGQGRDIVAMRCDGLVS